MSKIRWGILSTAKIAREQFIPAVQKSHFGEVTAICSRDAERAARYAGNLGIPRSFGSYEEMLEDTEIDAIYNPLPNDMHVPWTIRAIDKGKHVLCEKPIALTTRQAEQLIKHAKSKPDIKVMEAFMYRFQPQWQIVRNLVDEGIIGKITNIQSHFTYYKDDPANIRSNPEKGGGGLMDIGCYCISQSRWLLNKEPLRAEAQMVMHPRWKVDILTQGMLDFGDGQLASFTCGTQTFPDQFVEIYGNKGKIRINRPFNVGDISPVINVQTLEKQEDIEVAPVNQYTLQADSFARAILDGTDVPTPLDDAYQNMKVIDALFRSADSHHIEKI